MSRDLNQSHSQASYEADGRWRDQSGDIIVEVKRTHSTRDVREAFLALAYLLSVESSKTRAVCVLVDSRLSVSRVHDELDRFHAIVHPEIARRLDFLVRKDGQSDGSNFSGSMQGSPSAFFPWLEELIANEQLGGHRPSLPPRQVVVAVLAQLRLWNQPPITVKALQELSRVSYPTASAVLKSLVEKGLLEASSERGVRLRYLSAGEWMDMGREHAQLRKTILFTDPTGQASPMKLAERLANLQTKGRLPRSVRIGGVMGASYYFRELDITAAPRLDLSVETEPTGVAALLDAGLVLKTKPEQHVAVALHLTRDPWLISDLASLEKLPWAGELECLADLIEMGFVREAIEMAHHIEMTNKTGLVNG